MTRGEAAALLGVSEDAAEAQVHARYQELYSDFQLRLTHAPSPALKKMYQKNLQEVEEARGVLLPHAASSHFDLPARTPQQPNVGVGETELRKEPHEPEREHPVEPEGLPKIAIAALVAAVAFAAIASLMGVLWWQGREERAQARQLLESAAGSLQSAASAASVWKSAPLAVCNRSRQALTILSVAAINRDPGGNTRTMYSGAFDYPTWEVPPGERVTLSILRGGPNDWDGSAAIYALLIRYPGVEPVLAAGLMSEAKDGCVNLFLD